LTSLLDFSPPVIGHRGCAGLAPENTLASIRMAAAQKVEWISLDIKISADGVPVLMHDEDVRRTTNGQGLVSEMSWESLSQLDAGSWFGSPFAGEPVPSLVAAVELVLSLDLSLCAILSPCAGRQQVTAMVSMIELARLWPEHKAPPVIASFDVESLEMAAQLEPHWPRCLLMPTLTDDWRARMTRTGGHLLGLQAENIKTSDIEEITSLHIPLQIYTVNNPQKALELMALGVSTVYSDDPRLILDAL